MIKPLAADLEKITTDRGPVALITEMEYDFEIEAAALLGDLEMLMRLERPHYWVRLNIPYV